MQTKRFKALATAAKKSVQVLLQTHKTLPSYLASVHHHRLPALRILPRTGHQAMLFDRSMLPNQQFFGDVGQPCKKEVSKHPRLFSMSGDVLCAEHPCPPCWPNTKLRTFGKKNESLGFHTVPPSHGGSSWPPSCEHHASPVFQTTSTTTSHAHPTDCGRI